MNRVKLRHLAQHKLDISFGFFDTHEKEKFYKMVKLYF